MRAEALKATSGFEAPEKTSGKEILRKAGKAAKDFAEQAYVIRVCLIPVS